MWKDLKKLLARRVPQAPPMAPAAPTAEQEALNASLAAAVADDNVAAIYQALGRGAQIKASAMLADNRGRAKPLHLAAIRNCAAATAALLDAGANVDGDGDTLFFAAGFGHTATVKILLEAGAAIDLPYSFDQRTPLHMASHDGELDVAILLLAAGADPLLKGGHYNDTPAEAARRRKQQIFADYVQAVADDPAKRPTPESVGLDMNKRITALEALGRPLGLFTQAELKRAAQRKTLEAQRQEALRGGGI